MRRFVALFAVVAVLAIFAGQPRPAASTGAQGSMREARHVLHQTWNRLVPERQSREEEGLAAPSTARQVRRGIADQSGNIRPGLFLKGVRQTQRMAISPFLHPLKHQSRRVAGLAQAPITGSQWTEIGPGPLRTGNGGSPDPNVIYSGEVVDIAISPEGTTDQIVYVATNDGGVWKTEDGGTTWSTTTDNMPSLSMGAVAIDPTNPADVWAGTGDYFDGGGFYSGNGAFSLKAVGLYQSIDAGATWSTVNPGGIFTGRAIQKIVFPGPGQLLVATSGGLYYSTDNGVSFGNNSPTFNNSSPVLGGFISDLALDTTAANTVMAAVSGTGIFQSTNGGQTWPAAPFFTPTTSVGPPAVTAGLITFAQSTLPNNQTLYVNVALAGFFRAGFNGVYKSTAGTAGPFTQILTTPPSGSCFCGYSVETAVDPQDATRVYLGYINVFRSTSGGVPAGSFTNQSGSTVHADQHGFAFSPTTHYTPTLGGQTQMWTGEDGGIAVTTDGGNTFANKQGTMSTLLFNGIDIGRGSSANRAYSYGGTQDNGTPARQPGMSGTDWTLNTCCDSGPSAVDPTNGQHAIGSFNGGLSQTTNGGNSWATPAEGGIPANSTFGDNTARQTLSFDPNANTMYAAVATDTSSPLDQSPDVFGLYRSTDNGATFTQMGTGGSPFPTGSYPRAIATTKADSNTMWVALDNGQVWRTSNLNAGATSTWTQVTVTGAPALPIEGLALDPTNSQVAVAVYSGFSSLNPANKTKHVFRTNNNGLSWTDISGTNGGDPTQNFPDVPARGVVIDAGVNPHQIIVSTDTSVLRTLDNGGTWSRLGVGFPNVSGNTLSFDPSASPPLLRVGTYGRSAFELTASTGPALAVNGDLNFDHVAVGRRATRVLQLFNVGGADLHIFNFSRLSGSPEFSIISGPTSFPVTIQPGEEIDYTVEFKPTTAGDKTATFRIQSDDPNSPLDLPASGTGVTGVIRLTGDLNFGTVARGTSSARPVDIENIGEGFLHVSSWSMTDDNRFTIDEASPGSPIEIAPGAKITIHVRFSPSAADGPGTHTATLHVANDTPGNADATLAATGSVGVPQTGVSSSSLDFGGVPVDNRTTPHVRDIIVTVFNQASCNLCDVNVTGLAITGPNASDFTVVGPPALPYKIGAGNHLDLTVRFNPQDAGPRSATLTISSDDPGNPSIAVALSGSGLIPGISTPHDTTVAGMLYFQPTVYSPVCVAPCGTTINEPYQNVGAAELIVDSIAFTGSPAFSGPPATSPPSRFAPNSGGNEPVTFKPTAIARKLTGTMTITDTMGPSPTAPPVTRQVAFCGEGVGRGFRVLAVDAAGTPYAQLKSLKLISHGFRNNVNLNLKNLNLTTIDPPTSCRRIQFQYENQNLPDTTRAGNQGAYYDLTITVGNKAKTISFTLGTNEFKEIVMTIP